MHDADLKDGFVAAKKGIGIYTGLYFCNYFV